ncbi:MAG: hypothetical protein WDN49_10805 [Acetobacteraceae bacterium]
MAARHDVEDLLVAGDALDGIGDGGIDVREDGVDLVALDQLMGLLDARADIIGRILDQQLKLPPQDAAALVDLLHGEPGALHLGDGQDGQHAGERVDPAELDRGFTAGRDDVGRGELKRAQGRSGFDNGYACR